MSPSLWALIIATVLLIVVWKKAYMLLFVPWLYIPRNEFASTYSINSLLLTYAPPWICLLYMRNLTWRRQVAHDRDFVDQKKSKVN